MAQSFFRGCVLGKYLVIRDVAWWSRIGGDGVQDTVRGTEMRRNEKKMEAGEGRRVS
jgi:hypothetical protein